MGKDQDAPSSKKAKSAHPGYRWGEESAFKYELAVRIASGDGKNDAPPCKIVTIVMADDDEDQAIRDIELSVNLKIPVIVLEGSPLSNAIISLHKNIAAKAKAASTKDTIAHF